MALKKPIVISISRESPETTSFFSYRFSPCQRDNLFNYPIMLETVYSRGAYTPALNIEYLMQKPPVSSQAEAIAIIIGDTGPAISA